MIHSARVLEVTALSDLRLALAGFGEAAQVALELVDGEIRRMQQWLDTQLQFWKSEIGRLEEEVFIAKQALARKKMLKVTDRQPDTIEEEKTLRRAGNELRHAEEKAESTQNWLRQLDHELNEYFGPARALKTILENDGPRASALLEDKIRILEEYLQTAAPKLVAIPNEATVDADKPSADAPERH